MTTELRKKGNELYYQSQKEGMAPIIRKSRLQNAMILYQQSISSASKDDVNSISSSAKNYAKASYATLKLTDDFQQRMFFYKECFTYFSKAISTGRSCKSLDWLQDIKMSYCDLYNEILQLCQEEVDSLGEKTSILESIANVINTEDTIYSEIYKEVCTIWFNDACIALNENDFKRSLYSLKEMYHPVEQIRRYGKHNLDLMNHLESVEQDIVLQMARTESLQLLHIGDELLETHIEDDEDLNMDLIYTVIDNYRQCMVLTRGIEVEVEAIALSRLGKVYDQVLKMKHRARECFQMCINTAHTLAPRNFAMDPWYKLATEILERYQKETLQHQQEEQEKERQQYLKSLEPEMKLLKEAKSDFESDDAGFLLYVYDTFPPKIKFKLPKPKDVQGKDKKVLKKFFLKAVTYYHPDKQEVEKFGMKWKILCGEITKMLTRIYEAYKITE